jgi:hypothetical protein
MAPARLATIIGAMEDSMPGRLCRLHYAAGRIEACPGERCGLWEPGGVVLEGRCALDRVDLIGRPAFVDWLLQLREAMESPGTDLEKREVRNRFYRLLNDGDDD